MLLAVARSFLYRLARPVLQLSGSKTSDRAADKPVPSGTGLLPECSAGHDLSCSVPFSTWFAVAS